MDKTIMLACIQTIVDNIDTGILKLSELHNKEVKEFLDKYTRPENDVLNNLTENQQKEIAFMMRKEYMSGIISTLDMIKHIETTIKESNPKKEDIN